MVPRRCWPASAATRTAWRSRTTVWSAPTPGLLPSAERITASRPVTGERSCGSPPTNSSAACLDHILPDGFHRIRHYGLLASAARQANIAKVRSLLGEAQPETTPQATVAVIPLTLREPCPCCGGPMRIVEVFRRGQKPQSRAPPREQAAHRRLGDMQLHDPQSLPSGAKAIGNSSPGGIHIALPSIFPWTSSTSQGPKVRS